jgi:hypothetical protein
MQAHASDLKRVELDTPEKVGTAVYRTVVALKKRRV